MHYFEQKAIRNLHVLMDYEAEYLKWLVLKDERSRHWIYSKMHGF